ncbi:DUF485 domain-containing protein [Denitrificimonas caeni]|uniref:DUF485 domain-containing protein n=1 Tax=Denitrificimonas caeni TaxID=521720 RepID=UPI001964E641|nr:DUF485 domain-containing protein [Denitrificimonas caeni]
MEKNIYAHIRNNPKFDELVTKRRRFALVLSAIVLVLFYGFIMQVAFFPEVIAMPIGSGKLTYGVMAGFSQFSFFLLLTWLYVRRANTEFDRLNEALIDDAVTGGQA